MKTKDQIQAQIKEFEAELAQLDAEHEDDVDSDRITELESAVTWLKWVIAS